MKYLITLALVIGTISAKAESWIDGYYGGPTCSVSIDDPINSVSKAKITYPGNFGKYVDIEVRLQQDAENANLLASEANGYKIEILRVSSHQLTLMFTRENSVNPEYQCNLNKLYYGGH